MTSVRDKAAGDLAFSIAAELNAVRAALNEAVGSDNMAGIPGAEALVARAGYLADVLARAFGSCGLVGGAHNWMLCDAERDALRVLQGRDRDADAEGGAA